MLDAIVNHRVQLQRYSKREASVVLDLLGREDAGLISMLRARLPRVGEGRTAQLLSDVRAMRRESFGRVRSKLGNDMVALARVEGAAMDRLVTTALRISSVFNPVRDAQLRSAVSEHVFGGGGRGAGRTLEGWIATIAEVDKARLFGAIDLGVRKRESIDDQIRRIAGTRAAGYSDGVLAVSRRQAETLVRTAVVHAANAAQGEWAKANADVVAEMEQVEVLDDRTCDECEELNGRMVAVGETDDVLPVHLNCRGTWVPVINLDALADKLPDQVDEREERAA